MDETENTIADFAGAILYKHQKGQTEVMLVHKTGRSRKWTIPQIEVSEGEDFASAATKQLEEETAVFAGPLNYLGSVSYPKYRLHAFFGRASSKAEAHPSRLEIDKVQFVDIDDAKEMVDKRTRQLLESLATTLQFYEESA